MADTILQAAKLQLTTWFLALYRIAQAKTGISSLELSHHLGVNYDTAWLLHNKILKAISERDEADVLRGKIQIDDASLAKIALAARQVEDRRTRLRSLLRSL